MRYSILLLTLLMLVGCSTTSNPTKQSAQGSVTVYSDKVVIQYPFDTSKEYKWHLDSTKWNNYEYQFSISFAHDKKAYLISNILKKEFDGEKKGDIDLFLKFLRSSYVEFQLVNPVGMPFDLDATSDLKFTKGAVIFTFHNKYLMDKIKKFHPKTMKMSIRVLDDRTSEKIKVQYK